MPTRTASARRRPTRLGRVPFTFRRRGRAFWLIFLVLALGIIVLIRRFSDKNTYDGGYRYPSGSKTHPEGDNRQADDGAPSRENRKAKGKVDANPADDSDFKSLRRPRLPNHTWGNDGLVTVNPDGAHPIYELIRRAEAKWADKHKRASRTLEQAVKEYERRYSRPPPFGFDQWWNYVEDNNVQLPDEYDQIYMDLEPYWGIDPMELKAAQLQHEKHRDSFTIGKSTQSDVLNILNIALPPNFIQDVLARLAKPHMELMGEVFSHIPPFRAVISARDNPDNLADWTWRSAALEAARKGKFLKASELPPLDKTGFSAACPPRSPLRADPPAFDAQPTKRSKKSFIHDHKRAIDPCLHPQHLLLHSEFLKWGDVEPIPHRFVPPSLSTCGTSLHVDIRYVPPYEEDGELINDSNWEDKSEDRLLWRGSPAGMFASRWQDTQRFRLLNLTHSGDISSSGDDDEDDLDGNLSDIDDMIILPSLPEHEPVGPGDFWNRAVINNATMDIGISSDLECEDVLCDGLNQRWGRGWMSDRDMGDYKYLIDVDGNGRSDRFRKVMRTNALVFKATLYSEWYMDRIQAWVHYVPIQLDYSDLHDALTFFSGNIWGEGAHDDMAKKIALTGREWVLRYHRREDMVAYMFRLWLEYARVMNIDRETMNYQLPR